MNSGLSLYVSGRYYLKKPSISIRPILDLYRFEEYIIAIRVNDILGGASCKGSLILNACNGWQTWSTAVTSMG